VLIVPILVIRIFVYNSDEHFNNKKMLNTSLLEFSSLSKTKPKPTN